MKIGFMSSDFKVFLMFGNGYREAEFDKQSVCNSEYLEYYCFLGCDTTGFRRYEATFRRLLLALSFVLKTEPADPSETSLPTYQTARCNILDHSILHGYLHNNLRSYTEDLDSIPAKIKALHMFQGKELSS
jgi:hypothetical protein